MSVITRARRIGSALGGAVALVALLGGPVLAHEDREVAGYALAVGFINEPVAVGDRSGLEFFVNKGETPVEGLEKTLKAEVINGDAKRDLPISARYGEAGAYQSYFYPTAAGKYTFRITGTIDGTPIDESFTSSPDGFDEVKEGVAGQFPVQFPTTAELASAAQAGKNAASQVTLALVLAGVALLVGLVGIGLALATRRRPAA